MKNLKKMNFFFQIFLNLKKIKFYNSKMEHMKSFMEDKNIEEFGLDILRCLAKKAKIDRYYWMRKAELISALKTLSEGGVPQKPQKQPTAKSVIILCVHSRRRY